MFGSIGGPEIILIFIVALLVFGPKRLPEIGRRIGQVLGEVRKATGDLRANVEKEIGVDPFDGFRQVRKARRDMIATISEPVREAAKGTIGELRQASEQAAAEVRSTLDLPRGPRADTGADPDPDPDADPDPDPDADPDAPPGLPAAERGRGE